MVTDEEIRRQFKEADDFIPRVLRCGEYTLYAYAIDGLVSGGDMSEYILKPISENLRGENMGELYDAALHGMVYNSVAEPCEDLRTVYKKLVNGFCVVLFPDVGAIAFEIKTGVKRGPEAPEVENTRQHQLAAAALADAGSEDLRDHDRGKKSDQCGGGLDRWSDELGVGAKNEGQTGNHRH